MLDHDPYADELADATALQAGRLLAESSEASASDNLPGQSTPWRFSVREVLLNTALIALGVSVAIALACSFVLLPWCW